MGGRVCHIRTHTESVVQSEQFAPRSLDRAASFDSFAPKVSLQYQFGGGTAYSPVAIRSLSGGHNIGVGDPLPDALTGLLTAAAFTYTTAVAPPLFAQGARIGDSAIHRDAYNAYFEDSWKISDRLLLNYGLRY